MRRRNAVCLFACPLLLAAGVNAQAALPFLGNKTQLSDGGTWVYYYSLPSVGGTVGAPDLNGDIAYKGVPGNRLRSAHGSVDITSLDNVFLGDADWPSGSPDYYDIGFGTSLAISGQALDHLAPDFFTSGTITSLLSLGNSGLPHPCVISPTSTCSGSTACPPLVSGYLVDVRIFTPITVPTSNDDVTGVFMSQHLPGGMLFSTTAAVGSCGMGDFVFQGRYSETEEQADLLNQAGRAWGEGYQVGGPAGGASGSVAASVTRMTETRMGTAEAIVEPVITDVGYGPVRGGASLAVDTSTGTASIAVYVSADPSLAGNFAFPAASTVPLPIAAPIFGANLLIAPTGTFNATFAAWSTTGVLAPVAGAFGLDTHAEATSPAIPLPVISATVYLQAFIVTGTGPITAVETTSWAIDLR